jgi:hypothetical protein
VGMTVKMEMGPDPAVTLATDLRRGLVEAGHAILALSDAQAPREETPRHGVHMTETGFVAATVLPDGEDAAVIGYGAFWAAWQHERLDWHHDQGHAKFLELAVVEGEAAAYAILAVAAAKGLGAV